MYIEEDSLFSVPVNNRDQNEITLFFMSIDIGVTPNSPYIMNIFSCLMHTLRTLIELFPDHRNFRIPRSHNHIKE